MIQHLSSKRKACVEGCALQCCSFQVVHMMYKIGTIGTLKMLLIPLLMRCCLSHSSKNMEFVYVDLTQVCLSDYIPLQSRRQ